MREADWGVRHLPFLRSSAAPPLPPVLERSNLAGIPDRDVWTAPSVSLTHPSVASC